MKIRIRTIITLLLGMGITLAKADVPLSSSTRPFIWADMSERDAILQKIEDYSWAQSLRDQLISRVQSNLNSYESNRDAYLRALPVDWSRTAPRYFLTEDEVNGPLRNKIDTAQDCAVIYYLTGDERYGALAADVLHNATRWFPNTPKSSNTNIGGWTFHDVEWLYESRSIGSQMPIIYDFMHGFLQQRTVYDVKTQTLMNFDFDVAQEVFKDFRNLCRDRGLGGSNWCALMGDCMILNTLALDNISTRTTYIDEFFHTSFPRQDSLDEQEEHFDGAAPYSCYPESLGYSKGVVERNSYYIMLMDRYDPSKNYPAQYPKLIQSMHRTKQMHYPNNSYQLLFGDGHRLTGGNVNYMLTDLVYSMAKKNGRTTLMDINGGLLADGLTNGRYNRGSLQSKGSLSIRDEILPLLWGEPVVDEAPETLDLFRTDTLPYAGLALQRNLSPNGKSHDGLMTFVQGAGFVHSHASGMNMELYGCGRVLGVKAYGRTKYTRAFASANTVVVNGYSRGLGGWLGVAINTVQLKALEPAVRAEPVSPNHSFTCSSFLDNKGSGAEATQERTMSVIRTSPTTGYYFDLFRSNSSKSGEFHDYLYHNVGDSLTVTDSAGTPLSFTSQPDRFQNDTDNNKSPGWGYLTDTKATGTVTDSVRAQFKTRFSGESSDIYMDMHIPGDSAREYVTAMAPSDGEHPAPYNNRDIPTLIVHKNGEAWDTPFGVIYEPHRDGVDGGTVQQVSTLKNGAKVVGMKVESIVDGEEVIQYIISNTGANDTYEDPSIGLAFKGRFCVATYRGDGSGELYIGDGSTLSLGPLKVSSNSGNNTQVSVIFDSDLETTITANAAVTVEETGLSFFPVFGPIAHWPLDEGVGTVTTNRAKTSYTATLDNGAVWSGDETRETFVSFDGTDDRISTTFRYALSDTDDFTWAWWANKQSENGTDLGSIMLGNRYGNSGSENYEFIKFTAESVQFSNTDNTSEIERYDYADILRNEWHHYAMVKSGTNYQWYVDGVAEGAPQTIFYNESTPLPFRIGGDLDGKSVNEFFEGYIDDVILYKRALSSDEIGNVRDGIYFQTIRMAITGSPVEQTDGATWEDGLPAHEGANYIIQNGGNLRGPTGSSIFPANSLTVEAGGKFQVRALERNGEVATVDDLILAGGAGTDYALLVAGTGTDAVNVLDGTIEQSGATKLVTYGGTTRRSLKVLSQVDGDGLLQVVGEGAIIDNAANTFSGVWQVDAGATLQFNHGGAVGAADIEVLAGGTLKIPNDWKANATLTVSDSAATTVDLGAYRWAVSNLVFSGTVVADGNYSAAELNALGINPVFVGSGKIQVGPPPTYELIAGWEQWISDASRVAGVSATSTGDGWSTSEQGASTDGTWGSLETDPAADSSNESSGDGALLGNGAEGSLDFVLTNTSAETLQLGSFHFDTGTFRPDASHYWTLEVISGSVTAGTVASGDAVNIVGGTIDWHEYDIDLTGLSDNKLETGESATFRLRFTGGTLGALGHHQMLDNVAFTGSFQPVDIEPPVLEVGMSSGAMVFSWTGSGFKVQSRTNLVEGTWQDVPGGETPPVTNSTTETECFFRLIEQ